MENTCMAKCDRSGEKEDYTEDCPVCGYGLVPEGFQIPTVAARVWDASRQLSILNTKLGELLIKSTPATDDHALVAEARELLRSTLARIEDNLDY